MTEYTFESTLQKPDILGSWTYVVIPLNIEEIFGSKGQVKVRGTINGCPYRSSAMPSGDGTHYLVVKKEIRDKINATQGRVVTVIMTRDQEERTVALPDDFKNALETNKRAYNVFGTFSYSHQKEHSTVLIFRSESCKIVAWSIHTRRKILANWLGYRSSLCNDGIGMEP